MKSRKSKVKPNEVHESACRVLIRGLESKNKDLLFSSYIQKAKKWFMHEFSSPFLLLYIVESVYPPALSQTSELFK